MLRNAIAKLRVAITTLEIFYLSSNCRTFLQAGKFTRQLVRLVIEMIRHSCTDMYVSHPRVYLVLCEAEIFLIKEALSKIAHHVAHDCHCHFSSYIRKRTFGGFHVENRVGELKEEKR